MAETLVSDVIVPELYSQYLIERTAEKSELVQSGVVERSSEFDALAQGGGSTVNMPFWQDLSGADEVLSDSGSLTPAKISATKDIAVMNQRGKAWSTNDLAKFLSGDDPMSAIVDLGAQYWVRRRQAQLISMLKGVFSASDSSMDGNKTDINKTSGGAGTQTAANTLNGSTFVDATQLLGDNKDKLTAVIMHSAVEADLRKNNLIDFIPDSEGMSLIRTFQGLRVIIDDTMPTETVDSDTVYTSWLFGQGAVAEGNANLDLALDGGFGTEAVEFARTPLSHTNTLINRQRFIYHPRGVKFTSASVAGLSPTNTEFEGSTNWARVYEAKNVRIAQIKHNVSA